MPGIFEGVGIMTITGTAATIGLGLATPADCYVGLAMAPPSQTIKIKEPVGTLGCQYDFGDTRVFAEHISSPSVGNDWPGVNHAGVKQLFVNTDLFDVYAGASVAVVVIVAVIVGGVLMWRRNSQAETPSGLTKMQSPFTSLGSRDKGLSFCQLL